MEFNTILLFIIAAVITIYFCWNYISNRKPLSNAKQSNDIRYYELKSKYEFLVAVVSFGIAVAVFYGLGTKKEIESNLRVGFKLQVDSVKNHFKNQVDSISSSLSKLRTAEGTIDKQVAGVNKKVETYKGSFSKLDKEQIMLAEKSKLSKSELQQLNDTINKLKNKNILKQEFYIVTNLAGDINADLLNKFQFKDLRTSAGDRLPIFTKPPVVIPISGNNSKYFVARVTTEYVSLAYNGAPYYSDPQAPRDQSYNNIANNNPITLLIYELR